MKCPFCGTHNVDGSGETGSPIQYYKCENGHHFKTAMCFKPALPSDYKFDMYPYDRLIEWEPIEN